MKQLYRILILTGGLLTVSAAPRDHTCEEMIRRGNAAFERGDLAEAERLYSLAEEHTPDPGLVAFNQAIILIRKEEWREAELHLIRVLEDDATPQHRKAKALYNRGYCLLHRGDSVLTFRTAIACFEQSLRLITENDPLAKDIRDNLELAKILWGQARLKEKTLPKPSDVPPEAPQEPPPKPNQSKNGTNSNSQNDPTNPSNSVQPIGSATKPETSGSPRETTQKTPGVGTLPVILDTETPQPLSAEDTRALLQRIAHRLEADRRANSRLVAGPERPTVRDW